MSKLSDFSARLADGTEQKLADYAGQVALVVNVASKCGFTPQYDGLEALYEQYRPHGLTILAFPCNQFGEQEPGTELEISAFCRVNYGVTFPIFAKVEVNGAHAHPLYKWLKHAAPGMLGLEPIAWNFTKFLIDRTGEKVTRFASNVEPANLRGPIEGLL